ncbi:MAG: S-layer homology domain-containing protein, partial [Syntrophomonadaceae bacterium]|nr:S-layer homology domain-containing protein [Syntrophomonadaceae bacterium]
TIKALPYINELYYDSGAPIAREGAAYDLSQIPLRARDQHGDLIELPDDIIWNLADNNQTTASIEHGQLTVPEGTIPEASVADVILEAYSPTADRTASNVVVKVRQKPVLKRLTAAMTNDLHLRVDENAVLIHYFTVAGYDQYGEVFSAEPAWNTSNPAAIQLSGGILHALVEDAESLIYADCENSRGETITSNKISLKVGAPRRLSSISVSNAPRSAAINAVLSLDTLAVATFDQYGQEFTPEELIAYPSSIRWTLENHGTAGAINENILSFGSQVGKVTLICACVNSDTGKSFDVEKRIDIRVGPYVSAITPASANMPSAGGANLITLTGENLEDGLRISAFDEMGSVVPGITAVTTGTAAQQKATLNFPANIDTQNPQTYTLKLSHNDGTTYEAAPVATVTVAKKGSDTGGTGGGGGGGGGGISPSGTLIDSKGGTARNDDAKVVIPKDAVDTDIRVNINTIGRSGFTFPEGYRLVSSIFDFSKDKSGNFKKDVTITLPFDKSKADQEKDELAVFGWDGSGWNLLDNTEVDWSAGAASGTTDHFANFAVLAKTKAVDEPKEPGDTDQPEVPSVALIDISGHWAEEAIRSLVASGAINGYSDGTFKPDNTVTRAEFAQILVQAMGIPAADNDQVFVDTGNHWGRESIAATYAAGIISGYGDNRFGPNDLVTREQIAAMVVKAARLTGPSTQLNFADYEAISDWARESVAIAVANGLITGYGDQTFRPGNNATRAEAAFIISLALAEKK